MNTESTTQKIENDYAGNTQYAVLVEGERIATVRHIAKANIRPFSAHMTQNRSWVIAGVNGLHFANLADAARYAVKRHNHFA